MKEISVVPDTRHLRYFVAVAEELHFGRAAARLGIEQPPLSQQIRRFEKILGVPLFHRSRRHVSLSDAGRALLPEARRLLADAESMMKTAQRAGRGEVGQLTVAFTGTCALSPLLGTAVRRFRARHPGVALSLAGMHSVDQVEAIRNGRLELGLLRPPVAEDPRYELRRLPDEPVLLALPQGHAAAKRSSVHLSELRDEPFLIFPRSVGPGLYDRLISVCRRAGFEPQVVQEAPEFTSVIGLVAAGVGIALVPSPMRVLRLPGVVYRPLSERNAVVELGLVVARERLSEPARAFRDLILGLAPDQRGR